MNTSTSRPQCEHLTRSAAEADMARSPSHALHLKCIIGVMRALLVILLAAACLNAQSLADVARKERDRRSHLKSAQVIKAEGVPTPAGAKTEEGKKPAEPPKTPVDPVKEYNDQLQKLRVKVQTLMDDESATQLQLNELTNQINAPVVDQATKDQAVARLGDARQKLAAVRTELDQTRKTLETLQLQGPPKK